MTNEEIIDAIERIQGALERAESTMRQPAKYVAEAQAKADKVIETLRKRTWVGLTDDEIEYSYCPNYQEQTRTIEAKLKERNT